MPQMFLVQAETRPLQGLFDATARHTRPLDIPPVTARATGESSAVKGIGVSVLFGVVCYAGMIKVVFGLLG